MIPSFELVFAKVVDRWAVFVLRSRPLRPSSLSSLSVSVVLLPGDESRDGSQSHRDHTATCNDIVQPQPTL